MARVCREGGARVQFNAFLRDLNLGVANVTDGRRLEVIANGLPLFKGAQLAIDTTIVCPVRRDGTPNARTATKDGISLEKLGFGKKNAILSSMASVAEPGWSYLLWKREVGGARRLGNSCTYFRKPVLVAIRSYSKKKLQ